MKYLFLLVGLALAFSCFPQLIAQANTACPYELQGDQKLKVKDGNTIVRDKSKPVRKAIEDWYERNTEAFEAKDVAAIMALRAADFHTITPDGRTNTLSDMKAYTERFLGMIDRFVSREFHIAAIKGGGGLASTGGTQKSSRMQRFPGGTLQKVEAGVVQRETWKKTTEGCKLCRVDNIRGSCLLVDGK